MALPIHLGNQKYHAVAADKPYPTNVPANAELWETDTGIRYQFNGTVWVITLDSPNQRPISSWSIYRTSLLVYEARNNKTGSIVYSHANFDNVLASIISNISPPGTPTSIELGDGDFSVAATFSAINAARLGNIKIKGQGIGLTNLVLQSTIGANVAGINIAGSVATPGKVLTVNSTPGSNKLTVSASDSATFTVGDYILLRTSKKWDVTSGTGKQGEIHKIKTINTSTGVIALHESTFDTYLVADTANIAKISMLQNITLEDLTIKPVPTGMPATTPYLRFYMIDNLQVKNVEIQDSVGSASSGIRFESVINSKLDVLVTQTGIYPFIDLPSTGQYGIWGGCASQHVQVNLQSRGWFRHAISGGGIDGGGAQDDPNAGIPRDITISGTADMAKSWAFDWHPDGDGIIFKNCNVGTTSSIDFTAPPQSNTDISAGINVRCKNAQVIGCNIGHVIGFGIEATNLANNTLIANNTIHYTKKFSDGTYGFGIRLTAGITGCVIANNEIVGCESNAILGDGTNHDTVITGNQITGCDAVKFTDATDVTFSNNRIKNGALRPLNMAGTCDFWSIQGNNIRGSGNPIFVGANNIVKRNQGYKTENSGTATMTSAATTVLVNHGLAAVPSLNNIKITRTNNPTNAGNDWISTPTSTQFTINRSAAPGASTATYVWQAEL